MQRCKDDVRDAVLGAYVKKQCQELGRRRGAGFMTFDGRAVSALGG